MVRGDPYAILIFEGKYLNGKIKQKGKEYFDNGELEFEGEYLNRERNNKAKYFNSKNILIIFIENNLIILYIL